MRLFAALLLAGALAAAFAETGQKKEFSPIQKKWWAFQPVKATPGATIDSLLLAKMAEKGVTPNPKADKVTLLRRATLVLTGLPPTPEQTQAFLNDSAPNAFEKVIDQLLASPQYGERWARHWLDLARYADSEGFKADETRPNVWRYRDYVIKSFNADKPYDRFVKEQIAGDELYPNDLDAKVAVGFNRHFPDESNAANIRQRRQELLFDITDTTGSVFLGLTYGCAKCHDHKFDPILHKDYYRLQAFYANTVIDDERILMPGPELDAYKAQKAEWESKTAAIRAEMQTLLGVPRKKKFDDRLSRFPEEIQETITMEPAKRSPLQWHMFVKAKAQVTFTDAECAAALKGAEAKRFAELKKELAGFDAMKPAEPPMAQSLADLSTGAPKTHVLKSGNFEAPMDEVAPGFLSILDPSDADVSHGRRTALANWLGSPTNPLTARVMVNRVWQQYFGRGLVETENDFGTQGILPTHPALLDWLATEFKARNWSLKALHRLIVTSATYRQASRARSDLEIVDPVNRLLARQSRLRLDAEVVRDVALAASGLLEPKLGGPPVYPPQPDGVMNLGQVRREWKPSEGPDRHRRGLYTHFWRATPHPALAVFDAADGFSACTRRLRSNTPLQALTLLNDRQFFELAGALADRIEREGGPDEAARINFAFKVCLSRTPTADEARRVSELLRQVQRPEGDSPAATPREAWVTVARVLLNLDETITRE